jgi:hypothetical protein
MAAMTERFRPNVPDAQLDDLRARLRGTRWPEPETEAGRLGRRADRTRSDPQAAPRGSTQAQPDDIARRLL